MTGALDLTGTDAFNPDGGFTISWRRKWDNPIFRNKQEAAVWVWMCDKAQWEPTRYRTSLGPVSLERGELVIAERGLAEDFGMHRNTLRTLLQRLVDDGMITLIRDRIPHRIGTIVRIEKYAEYQSFTNVRRWLQGRGEEEARTEEGPKQDRNGTTSKEVNKTKESNNSHVASQPSSRDGVAFGDMGMSRSATEDRWVKPEPTQADLLGEPGQDKPTATTKAKPKGAKKDEHFEPWMQELWDEFRAAYPSRGTPNPNKPGREAFAKRMKEGVEPEDMIAAAKAYFRQMDRVGKVGTEGVRHYSSFLSVKDEFWKQCLDEAQSANVHHLRPANSRTSYDQPRRHPIARGIQG